MVKFILQSVFVVAVLGQALAGAIGSSENETVENEFPDLKSNFTLNNETSLEPQYAAFYADNKVFYVFLIRLNYFSAAEYCSSQKLMLASIDTEEDNDSLVQKLKNNRLLFNGARFWLSGSDLGHNGFFTWLGNGRPFTYTHWLSGQPDNLGGNEHCVEMLYDGRWNDRDCNSMNFVICENRCALTSYDVPIYNK